MLLWRVFSLLTGSSELETNNRLVGARIVGDFAVGDGGRLRGSDEGLNGDRARGVAVAVHFFGVPAERTLAALRVVALLFTLALGRITGARESDFEGEGGRRMPL
jgi:hypothetical protein